MLTASRRMGLIVLCLIIMLGLGIAHVIHALFKLESYRTVVQIHKVNDQQLEFKPILKATIDAATVACAQSNGLYSINYNISEQRLYATCQSQARFPIESLAANN